MVPMIAATLSERKTPAQENVRRSASRRELMKPGCHTMGLLCNRGIPVAEPEPFGSPSAEASSFNHRGYAMKLSTSFAIALGVVALAGCHKSPADQEAANVEANYDNEAANIQNSADNEAQAIQNSANNEASAIKNEGENKAAEIRNSADNSTSNATDNKTDKKGK